MNFEYYKAPISISINVPLYVSATSSSSFYLCELVCNFALLQHTFMDKSPITHPAICERRGQSQEHAEIDCSVATRASSSSFLPPRYSTTGSSIPAKWKISRTTATQPWSGRLHEVTERVHWVLRCIVRKSQQHTRTQINQHKHRVREASWQLFQRRSISCRCNA